MLFFRKLYTKQYTYDVIDEPAPPYIPLDLIKQHLRLPLSDVTEDDYLTLLSSVVYKYAEKYTKRTFLTTSFRTFRDTFAPGFFVLRRSPLQTVESVEYLLDGVWLTLDTLRWYNTLENDYSRILPTPTANDSTVCWPLNIDCRQQSIRIDFVAGYGDIYTDIPSDLIIAMLQHISRLYESRGDCDDAGCSAALPAAAKAIYDIYKIRDITGQDNSGYVYG